MQPHDLAYCVRVDLDASFSAVQQRIEKACLRVQRDPASVTLLAVTKSQPPEVIRAAFEQGQTLFGENKVQEARTKIGLCPRALRWHMIGHLQSNKCRDAVHFFDMIQSVDSLKLAQELDKWASQSGKTLPILLEVNIAGESSKFGFRPEQVLSELESINALRKIEIHGLMTIAPWTSEPEKVRPIFRQLRELKLECEERLGAPLPHLSMGMSNDFEIAIEEGASLVRLGTILFGNRPKPKKPQVFEEGP